MATCCICSAPAHRRRNEPGSKTIWDARVAAQLVEQKRLEEKQRNQRAAESNTFSKLVAGQKQQAQLTQKESAARSAIAQLLEAAEARGTAEAGRAPRRSRRAALSRACVLSWGARAQGEKAHTQGRVDAQTGRGHASEEQGSAMAMHGQQGDAAAGELGRGRWG